MADLQHPNASMATCPNCRGTGAVQTAEGAAPGQTLAARCPWCKGAGQLMRSNTTGRFLRALYWYAMVNQAVNANTAVSGAMQIDSRADFEAVWMVSTSTGTYTTSMTDKSGRTMQSAAVNNANQWGTAQLPFTLPVPVVMPRQSAINWTVTDTSAGTNTIQNEWIGYELYPQLEDVGMPSPTN